MVGLIQALVFLSGVDWSVDSIADLSCELGQETLASRGVVLANRFAVLGPHLNATKPRLVVPKARLGEKRQDLELAAASRLEQNW